MIRRPRLRRPDEADDRRRTCGNRGRAGGELGRATAVTLAARAFTVLLAQKHYRIRFAPPVVDEPSQVTSR
jgi:hypothetical protein